MPHFLHRFNVVYLRIIYQITETVKELFLCISCVMVHLDVSTFTGYITGEMEGEKIAFVQK